MSQMINFVGHNSKEKKNGICLVTIATATNYDSTYPILYSVYKSTSEFFTCFDGMKRQLVKYGILYLIH